LAPARSAKGARGQVAGIKAGLQARLRILKNKAAPMFKGRADFSNYAKKRAMSDN